jgi:hypothetical protein
MNVMHAPTTANIPWGVRTRVVVPHGLSRGSACTALFLCGDYTADGLGSWSFVVNVSQRGRGVLMHPSSALSGDTFLPFQDINLPHSGILFLMMVS